MKIFLSIITAFLVTFGMYAQNDVTKFMGIPVDGSKKEMTKALKKKGFKSSKIEKDALIGIFNGSEVYVKVLETKGKVSRVAVVPVYSSSESEIRILFNNLCYEFLNKDNYLARKGDICFPTYKDISIPKGEDISSEMAINNKQYEASFIQLPAPRDSIYGEFDPGILSSLTVSDEKGNEVPITTWADMITKYSKNSVWFRIGRQYGKYFITMFYDNEFNMANGEDL